VTLSFKEAIVDVKCKWVCFDEHLAVEAFMTICEEQGYSFHNVLNPRHYLDGHIKQYRESIRGGCNMFFYGYFVKSDGRLSVVKFINGNIGCISSEFNVDNKFTFDVS
jgi:hypothetical protein